MLVRTMWVFVETVTNINAITVIVTGFTIKIIEITVSFRRPLQPWIYVLLLQNPRFLMWVFFITSAWLGESLQNRWKTFGRYSIKFNEEQLQFMNCSANKYVKPHVFTVFIIIEIKFLQQLRYKKVLLLSTALFSTHWPSLGDLLVLA